MNLFWQERALGELDIALAYISERNPDAAYALVESIFSSAERNLPDNPHIGRPGRVEGTREWVTHKNYVIVYRVRQDRLDVLSVHHAARLWPEVY